MPALTTSLSSLASFLVRWLTALWVHACHPGKTLRKKNTWTFVTRGPGDTKLVLNMSLVSEGVAVRLALQVNSTMDLWLGSAGLFVLQPSNDGHHLQQRQHFSHSFLHPPSTSTSPGGKHYARRMLVGEKPPAFQKLSYVISCLSADRFSYSCGEPNGTRKWKRLDCYGVTCRGFHCRCLWLRVMLSGDKQS